MFRQKNGTKRVRGMLVLGIILLSSGVLWAEKAPKIKFRQDKWNFGKTSEGKELSHTFVFINEGEGVLKIEKVTTSCGCAAALVSKKSYRPGEQGEIKVTFNTRGYEGEVSKYVYVESNDPKQQQKLLTVTAAIDVPPRPRIELNTYTIDLGLLLEGDEIQTSATISNKGEKELSVVLGHKDAEFFLDGEKISDDLKIASNKDARIVIKMPSRKKSGLIREYILMRSNDPTRPNISLYLSGYAITKQQLRELFDKYKNLLR